MESNLQKLNTFYPHKTKRKIRVSNQKLHRFQVSLYMILFFRKTASSLDNRILRGIMYKICLKDAFIKLEEKQLLLLNGKFQVKTLKSRTTLKKAMVMSKIHLKWRITTLRQ